MPGPSRIKVMCVSCSLAGHVAVFGGLWLAGWRPPVGQHAALAPERVLVMEMIPQEVAAPPRAGSRPMTADRRPPTLPPLVRIAGGRDSAAPRSPARFLAVDGADPAPPAAPRASSPAPVAVGAQLSDYQRRLYEIVARNCRYPAEARRLHVAGITHLAFKLDRDGTVTESWIEASSGSEMLDEAALDALDRSQPLPAIPAALPGRMDFIVEIDSSVTQQHGLALGSHS